MADLVVIVGQVLSVIGLVYGWYLSLLYCGGESEVPAHRGEAILRHHLAMA